QPDALLGRVDGDPAGPGAFGESRHDVGAEAGKLHHLDQADGSSHGHLFWVHLGFAFDHTTLGGLTADGALQRHLPGHDLLPLEIQVGRVDQDDLEVVRDAEGVLLEGDAFGIALPEIDLDWRNPILDQARHGSRWAAYRHVNARGNARHELFGSFLRGEADDADGYGALLDVLLAMQVT